MTAYRVVESSGSNGSIQFAVDGEFSSSSKFVFVTGSERLGVGTESPEAKLHVVGSTVIGNSASDLHQFTGSAVFATGLSGSLQEVSSGVPYLVAGENVTISTGSNGQITISASGAGYGAVSKINKMSWMETPAGLIDGLNMVYTLAYAPMPRESLMLYVNGVLQSEGISKDYVLADNSFTIVSAPLLNDRIVASYAYVIEPETGTNISWMEMPVGSIDGLNQSFMLSRIPYPSTALMLYYNGVLQRQGPTADYVINGGNNIVTHFTAALGSNMRATYPY